MSQRERYEQGGVGRWYWDFRDRAIMRFIGKGPILDAGCGEMITTRKIGAIGMDLGKGDVRGSVYSIPFKDESFETVLFSEVIEHLKQPSKALQEIRRVLKPGGRVIVVFPHDLVFKIAWFLFGMWGQITKDLGHVWKWYPDTAKRELNFHGFRLIGSRGIPFNFWPFSLHHIIVGEKC